MNDEFNKPNIGLARNTARQLLKNSGIKSYPIKLKDIAENISDLVIDGDEFEEEISGMQATYKGVSFIRYNTSHSIKRNRFTVAHELGHVLLGHTIDCDRDLLSSRKPQEIEANQFAAELLVPLDMLKKAIDTITTVDQLARAFWVSKESMNWRMLETGQYTKLTSWH